MKRRETIAANGAVGLRAAPSMTTAAGRLFGLNAGDWSLIVLGLLLSGFMLALA
jgi:hypothetical protein